MRSAPFFDASRSKNISATIRILMGDSVSPVCGTFFCHIKEYSFLCHGNFREYAMIHNDFLYKIHVCKLMVGPFILLDRTNNILLGSFLSACFSSCCQLVLLLDFRTKG